MRVLSVALFLAPMMLSISTSSSAEPIFLLNCRLINSGDPIFHQHCKAQDKACRDGECSKRAKRKITNLKTRVPTPPNSESTVHSISEGVHNVPSTDLQNESAAGPSDSQVGDTGDADAQEGNTAVGAETDSGSADGGSESTGGASDGGAESAGETTEGGSSEGGTVGGSESSGS